MVQWRVSVSVEASEEVPRARPTNATRGEDKNKQHTERAVVGDLCGRRGRHGMASRAAGVLRGQWRMGWGMGYSFAGL